MDTTELEAAHHAFIAAAAGSPIATPGAGEWDVETVLAHVVASSRMLAAAAAELLAGRIPVVDNRPTQVPEYLAAIAASVGDRNELVGAAGRSLGEVVTLVSQLSEEQAATSVPTIILDAGRVRVQRPLAFSTLVEPDHVRQHTQQLRALAQETPS